MAGYTRQSTASIINGSSITAPPINAEFNQLLAAFNASSGHGHTGGTGDAPKIPLTTSVSGYLPLAHGGVGGRNNVTNSVPGAGDDSADGYAPGSIWENSSTGRVYICVGNSSGAAVWRELVQVDSGNAILPASNDSVDLGNNSTRFQDLFLSGGISATGNVAIGGTLTTVGTSAFTGLATFANLSATGTTTITSVDLNSGAIDNAVIGSATPVAGTFTTLNANTSLVAATADINGGTLDGATVGASVPSTGAFTTLTASGTSTLTTVDINGGNIDGTVIGASATAAGSFTTLSTSGQATLATADINGGSIDGSTIGASSASTGAFTTLTSSGGITGNVTGNLTGNVTGNVTGDVTGNVTGNLTGNVTAGSGTSTFTNVTIDGTLNMNAGTSATIQNLTAPTNDLDAATKKYVDDEISTLIGDAGAGLDTLGELADALNDDDDFSTTVTNSIATKLPKAGGTMTGAIAMSTNKITGAGDPTSAQDVSTKAYTDTQRDTRVAKTGDTMSGALAMGNNKITGLATPTAGTDVTNKTYVDGILGSATVAATSATNAATSETNAATSATNASNSATSAATSATNAASSYDQFDDRYLGSKSSAPTVDNDGDALITGALYFNSTSNIMYVYGGSGWQAAGSSVNGTSERNTYTATAGQTVFAAAYDTGYIDVYLNGVKLLAGTDFTATNGTSITLASGASVNDVVDIVAYGTFALADHYTRTASDARYVEVAGDTMTGDLSFGDNDKAIFGAGSDLQIYHDGSHSIIKDAGAGYLKLGLSNAGTAIQNASGTNLLVTDAYAVSLRYNGGQKLATTSTGVAVTGNATFADNGKAIFGAGSDLQIYHNGSNSYITDAGQGKLIFSTNGTAVDVYDNANGHTMAQFTNNGAVSLSYQGSTKIATTSTGIDVTGTVTSDGLTVDGNPVVKGLSPQLFIQTGNGNTNFQIAAQESTNNAFEIASGGTGIDAPNDTYTKRLVVQNTGDISFYEDTGTTASLVWDSSQTQLKITGRETSRGGGVYAFDVDNSAQSSNLASAGAMRVQGYYGDNLIVNGLGDVSFFDDSNVAKFFWDASAESLGIGTSSPTAALTVTHDLSGSGDASGFRLNSAATSTSNTLFGGAVSSGDYSFFQSYKEGTSAGVRGLSLNPLGGNVGIGTDSPAYKLETKNGDISTIKLTSAAGGNAVNGMRFRVNNSANTAQSATLGMINAETVSAWGGALTFSTKPTNSTPNEAVTERMRITSAGYVGMGVTSPAYPLEISLGQSSATVRIARGNTSSGFKNIMLFRSSSAGADVGAINITNSATQYATSSDYRLKENVVDLTGASARVNQLNPSRFNFIADGTDTVVDGFLAHEVADVVPEAINGTKDAMKDEEYEVTPAVLDDDGNVTTEAVMGTRSVPDYQGIDQSKLVPLLTAALQEALTEIASLKTRVEALEA